MSRIRNVLRNSHRAFFSPHSVQGRCELYNEEQNEIGKVEPPFSLSSFSHVQHRSDPTQNTNCSVPSTWLCSLVSPDGDGQLKLPPYEFAKHFHFTVPVKNNTEEVPVPTDLSGEINGSAKRYETLDIENHIAVELMKNDLSTEAVNMLLHASENGHADAMNNLADCLYNGRGARKNRREAFRLWKEAAALRHSVAMYNLAVCHIAGEGTCANEQEGLKWMWLAANSGNSDASFYLILKLMHQGKLEEMRHLLKNAVTDLNYRNEICSWIRDRVVDEACLAILRDELGMN